MRIERFSAMMLMALATAAPASAQQYEWTSGRPDGHAPLGVMGEHTHEAGEWMVSYRFMRMNMDGNRDGTDAVEASTVLDTYMVSPVKMPMNMHMFGVMFAPSDRLTLMGMVPYVDVSMDHVTRGMGDMGMMGDPFTTEGSGIGDVKLTGLISVDQSGPFRAHVHAGVSLPTGSIEVQDVTGMSMGSEVQLPYPMQIGSGTVDLLPGITLLAMNPDWSWGAQGRGVVRLGTNDRDYALGNRLIATTWVARRVGVLSFSVRGLLESWGNIDGSDPDVMLNMTDDMGMSMLMVPTADPSLRGGTRFDIPLGVNFRIPSGPLLGHRLAAEIQIPVYQSLDGPQLETDWTLLAGWQWSIN